jgi:tetratricopeptide (TPR) repeat protein
MSATTTFAPAPARATDEARPSAVLALAEGDLDGALVHARTSVERVPGNYNFGLGLEALRWVVRWEQGRIDPDRLASVAASLPFAWLEALMSLVRAEHGDLDGAAAVLDSFASRDDLGVPFNSGQAPTLAALAETAAHVGDSSFAAALVPYVMPYRGQLLAAFLGNFCAGAADRALGLLALARGDADTAIAHLEAGLALEEGFRADALVARSRYWLARALRARGGPSDADRAEGELRAAAEIAERRGLIGIQHLVKHLIERLGHAR